MTVLTCAPCSSRLSDHQSCINCRGSFAKPGAAPVDFLLEPELWDTTFAPRRMLDAAVVSVDIGNAETCVVFVNRTGKHRGMNVCTTWPCEAQFPCAPQRPAIGRLRGIPHQ